MTDQRPRPQSSDSLALSDVEKVPEQPDIAKSDKNSMQDTPDPDLVEFEGPDDPYHPMNWSLGKKLTTTAMIGLLAASATWASTAYNSGVAQVQAQFHISFEVAVLGLSLFLFGNATGPFLFAPISEAFGRKYPMVMPIFIVALFSFATATAKDVQTIMLTRFFGGVFASAPLTIAGGVMADIWPPRHRAAALLSYGLAVVGAPFTAPIVGGALVLNLEHTGWRWTEYVTGILLVFIFILALFLLDESYPPVLLARKANRLRFQTKNWAIHSKAQEFDTSAAGLAKKYLIVPFEMLVDPISFVMNLYASFAFAIIYLAITAFPIEFERVRGWNAVTRSLPFLTIFLGALLAVPVMLWGQSFYRKRLAANNAKVVPEARLPPMMVGSVVWTAGFFIMGWTSRKDIHWIGFCIGGGCIGFGFLTIFQSAFSYLIDTFLSLAASAIAVNLLMRSMLAGGFPLVSNALFDTLGLDWGMSLLGFISAAMMPIPFLFYVYGRTIRSKGKYSKRSFIA